MDRTIAYMPVGELIKAFHPANPKDHDLEELRRSMQRFGFTEAVLLDERTGLLAAGHGRVELLAHDEAEGMDRPDDVFYGPTGEWTVPVQRGWYSKDDTELLAYVLASNQLTIRGGWVDAGLADALQQIASQADLGLSGVGFNLDDLAALRYTAPDEPEQVVASRKLAERFLVPPFSVLDARQGYWQERKRAWIQLGIQSELGRPQNALRPEIPEHGNDKLRSGAYGAQARVGADGRLEYTPTVGIVSVFDPVLCELAYRWWCPAGGLILDPFAGGSVRGVTAARLGYNYYGVDLRADQVDANYEQYQAIRGDGTAQWVCGDSRNEDFPERADFIFTCPPYYDLERYSDDPSDLANAASYDEFMSTFAGIIARVVTRLRDDRFACITVGEVRGPGGLCRGLVSDTVEVFRSAGLSLYNECTLITPVGSLAVRAAKIFEAARKVGKGHQNVLVFVKGDPERAAGACAPVERLDLSEYPSEEPSEALDAQEEGHVPHLSILG